MKMIVVAGMPGAGKEEFLNASRDSGVPSITMGDIVRECYASSGAEAKGLSVGQFASEMRKEHGADVWARKVMEKMQGNSLFIVDGCRSMDEIKSFKDLGGDVVIVAIHSSPSVRYDRLVRRQRADAPANLEEFQERDNRELSWGVGNVLALSDYLIDNMSGIEEFHRKSAELLEFLR